jgi:uncharacterized membrane protein
MDWAQSAVQFLHIAGGAIWLGASVFANAVLLPSISLQAPERRRELIGLLILGPERLVIAGALVAAVTGLALGLGYEGIRSVGALSTTYGIVWLASVLVAIGVFAVGGRVTSPAARSLRDDASVWAGDPTSIARADALMARLRIGFRLELTGIAVVLGLMVILAGI